MQEKYMVILAETKGRPKWYLYLYGILSFEEFFQKEDILHFSVTN